MNAPEDIVIFAIGVGIAALWFILFMSGAFGG